MAEQKNNAVVNLNPLQNQSLQITDDEITIYRDLTFKIRHPDGKRQVPWPSDCEPSREALGDNLAFQYIYEWQHNDQWNRAYELEVNGFMALRYSIDLNGTENMEIQSAFPMNGQILTIELQPFEREVVIMISCDSKALNQFNISGKWQRCDIDPLLYSEAITIANNRIKSEYTECLEAGLNENVPWHKMPDLIRNNNLHFVDGEFFPGNESLYFKGDEDANVIGDEHNTKYVMWRRAGSFIDGSHPMIFQNASDLKSCVKPQCVRMGHADDAWLISVISVCALRPCLLTHLFISNDEDTEDKLSGFYQMRMCHGGVWTQCIVDDLFPCTPYGTSIMARCNGNNQLWPLLIEKLVAKLRGNCYEALDGGSPSDAFADLTGCPTETFDLRECDPDHVFDLLDASYNENGYDILAVAICDEYGDIDGVDAIGLLSNHSYSILGIHNEEQRIRFRDPFGQNLQDTFKGEWSDFEDGGGGGGDDGIVWVSFGEFVQYFSSVIVCYAARDYTEARRVIDISYDTEKEEVAVPVLQLTVPKGGNVEYLGLSQKDLLNASSQRVCPLDICLFVLKSSADSESLYIENGECCGFIPMSTERNKFVKFGATEQEVESNDIASGMTWKNGESLTEGTYFLVPWTSGLQWKSEEKDNGDDDAMANSSRFIGLTVHGQCSDDNEFTINPVDGYSGREMDDVLMEFATKYGQKKKWGELERCHFQMGQLDIYCGRNMCNDKHLLLTMTPSEMSNVTNAPGFEEFTLNQEKEFRVEVGKGALFAVNVPIDPTKEYSTAYKYGLKKEYL